MVRGGLKVSDVPRALTWLVAVPRAGGCHCCHQVAQQSEHFADSQLCEWVSMILIYRQRKRVPKETKKLYNGSAYCRVVE